MAKITRGLGAKSRLPAAKAIKKAAAKPELARAAKRPAGKKPPKPKSWSAADVYEAFSRFRNANPEPKGELEHLNAYTLLVAVVLSAQATDAGVNKATPALFALADTPEKMVALGEARVRGTTPPNSAISFCDSAMTFLALLR